LGGDLEHTGKPGEGGMAVLATNQHNNPTTVQQMQISKESGKCF
jgi:hypothetical protein